MKFQPSDYGPAFAAVLGPRAYELGPGAPQRDLHSSLSRLTPEHAFAGCTLRNQQYARCCLAGAWLWNDFLSESHAISQEIETTSGSYWHGVMHRREPDYENSNYWFRRVGAHPVFVPLAEFAAKLSALAVAEPNSIAASSSFARELARGGEWDPYRFVAWCEAIARGKDPAHELARGIAQREWQLLFEYCYHLAVGSE